MINASVKSNHQLPLVSLLLLLGTVLAFADDKANETTATDAAERAETASVAGSTQQIESDLLRAAILFSPEYTHPVLHADGTPVAIYHELNGDGSTDVALLTVLAEPGVPTDFAELRETSRLFRISGPNPLFVLETYFSGDEAIQTVELGRRPALGGMELILLSKVEPFPVAVAIGMRDAAGAETNLIIYAQGGMVRRLQLQETEREQYQLTDLDGNGTVEIVVTRRIPEAGRGYETFLELLSADDNNYRMQASFGLVRELQRFLSIATDHMTAGRWDELELLVRADGAEEGALSRAFRGVPDEDESEISIFDYREMAVTVTAVAFPILLENPIPYPYLGMQVPLVFRVECCDEFPRFYSAIVALSEDPFHEPRFIFLTGAGTQR